MLTYLKSKLMVRLPALVLTLLITSACATSASVLPGPSSDSELPKVLIIGDSISIGYTDGVKEALSGIANVHRIDTNGGDTRKGVRLLTSWLGGTQWDLIHFNWGLHDLAYRHPKSTAVGNRDKINGTISVPLRDYKTNLESLVKQLEVTGAILIWANTTTVPNGEVGRIAGDERRYNRAAEAIMKRHYIRTNDLNALTSSFDDSLFVGPGDVHYTEEGYANLAMQVADRIKAALQINNGTE